MKKLITRLKLATEGARDLDGRISRAIDIPDLVHDEHGWWIDSESGTWKNVTDYTTSLDAALTLVPDDWHWYVGTNEEGPDAIIWYPGDYRLAVKATASTPALALCIAALKARDSLSPHSSTKHESTHSEGFHS